MPAPGFIGVGRGLNTRGGLGPRPGWVLAARNSRYLPGDTERRLWAVLGRSVYGTFPANLKSIFPYYIDGGASYLVGHAGDSLYEGPLELTGTPSLALSIGGASERGMPFSYLRNLYYPTGPSADLGFWTRQPSGWVKGGHRTPVDTFTAAPFLTGFGFASSTIVLYTYRIWDETTGTESAHGPVVEVPPFSGALGVKLTFPTGIQTHGERGTHVRFYRTLLDEPAGKFYRWDNLSTGGSEEGHPIAECAVPGFNLVDSTPNLTVLITGLVEADGEETSLAWAEHGGPPPKARGGMIFQDHAVLWGVEATDPQLPIGIMSESIIMYSAQGLPECYPVDFDGVYQYYLVFSSMKNDVVQLCRPAGPYMLVFTTNSIFRVLSLPTYQDAGFNRKVQDVLTVSHGCCSPWGADSFGIGTEESSYCIYVSREHGPTLTNGVSDRPIVDQANWLGSVNKAALDRVVVRNYSTMQECWIFYPGPTSGTNNKALIVSYADSDEAGIRVTGPVDVRGDEAFLGWTPSSDRYYISNEGSPTVYIQDHGTTDAQLNTNDDGDIAVEWGIPAIRLAGSVFNTADPPRMSVEGNSGSAIELDVTMIATDGIEEYSEVDTVQLGPGETDDFATAKLSGNSHRATISYTGPSGSNYDPSSAQSAPAIAGVTWERGSTGRQKRTSGT